MLPVEQPFKTYTGLDGKPLDNGYVWFGLPNQNPQTAPVTVFWDAAGTIPAAQPLRTVNGYIYRGGTPANVFFDGAYSEQVLDSKQRQVFYSQTSDNFSIATLVQTFLSNMALGTGAGLSGFTQNIAGAIKRSVLLKLYERISVQDLGNAGDGVADSLPTIITALQKTAAAGKTLIMPPATYFISDTVPLPTGTRWHFEPGAKLVLTKSTSTGGAICNPFVGGVAQVTSDIEIHNLELDCAGIAGENGFTLVSGSARLYSPKIRNCRHDPTKLGGRAFQLEGGQVDGVHIFNPIIENCTIGINSQASPTGPDKIINLNYHNVVMNNVDVPFNVDCQYANPDTTTLEHMSTYVSSATLRNCGKLTFPGNAGALGGGIICGDRGSGLKIDSLRLINDAAYGGIGAFVHGVLFNIQIKHVQIHAASMSALFDFGQVGFGFPTAQTYPSRVSVNGLSARCNLDYIVKGGSSVGRIGACRLSEIEVDATIATLTNVVDAQCAGATMATLELILTNDAFKTSYNRTLDNILTAGNTVGICQPDCAEIAWTPTDGSGAGLAIAALDTCMSVRQGREVKALCKIQFPVTADTSNAVLAGLPHLAANYSTFAGGITIGYQTGAAGLNGYVLGNTKTVILTGANGLPLKNADLSGLTLLLMIEYLAAS